MHILLFDIDGTLILTGGAGGKALLGAFSREFDVDDPKPVPFSGRTDRWIASSLFQLHEVDDSMANWQRLQTEYLRQLTVQLPLRQGQVLPGVSKLLDQMARRSDVAIGLLTGNVRDGARLKLEHYQLYHHFAFGGYGDRHWNRDDVAREAFDVAHEQVGDTVVPERVWVIGDTPFDVRCARAIGVRALAVTTGWHTREQLEETSPDLLLDTLEDAQPLLEQLNGAN